MSKPSLVLVVESLLSAPAPPQRADLLPKAGQKAGSKQLTRRSQAVVGIWASCQGRLAEANRGVTRSEADSLEWSTFQAFACLTHFMCGAGALADCNGIFAPS